jgi:ribosome-binding protein aMBF1 (putative translation factor)
MPEPTKNHRTEEIELHFSGPAEKKAAAISALTRLGFSPAKNIPPADSWRDNFSELQGNETGVILAGARHREALTQRDLSGRSGIPQRHISEMENGKRSIGKKNAKALARVLNTDYRVFL